MASENKVVEITINDFKQLQKSLKKLNKAWVQLLVDKIKEDNQNGQYSIVTEQKIYNVFNSRLTNGGWKIVAYKYGKELLSELQTEVIEAKQS